MQYSETGELRSIPASAGETPIVRRSARRSAVHPRECGGNRLVAWSTEHDGGPSPRVRGKPGPPEVEIAADRSIPASAGETRPCRALRRRRAVHPRECGGNADRSGKRQTPTGPSPRVRGKHPADPPLALPRGSIPASAGETPPSSSTGRPARVHPRECGGNARSSDDLISVAGPSPRVRGKLHHVADNGDRPRSIPASAGETLRGW